MPPPTTSAPTRPPSCGCPEPVDSATCARLGPFGQLPSCNAASLGQYCEGSGVRLFAPCPKISLSFAPILETFLSRLLEAVIVLPLESDHSSRCCRQECSTSDSLNNCGGSFDVYQKTHFPVNGGIRQCGINTPIASSTCSDLNRCGHRPSHVASLCTRTRADPPMLSTLCDSVCSLFQSVHCVVSYCRDK